VFVRDSDRVQGERSEKWQYQILRCLQIRADLDVVDPDESLVFLEPPLFAASTRASHFVAHLLRDLFAAYSPQTRALRFAHQALVGLVADRTRYSN